jgi:hypothetical protein
MLWLFDALRRPRLRRALGEKASMHVHRRMGNTAALLARDPILYVSLRGRLTDETKFWKEASPKDVYLAVSCPPPSQTVMILTLQESRQVHKKKMLSKALLLAGVAGATAFTAPSLPMTTRAAKSATSGKHQIHMHPTYVGKPGTHSPLSILRRRRPPRRQSFSRKRVAWSAAKPLGTPRGHDSTGEKLPAFFSSGSSVRFVTNSRGICRSRTCPTSSVTFSSRGCRVSLGGLFGGEMGGISHWM